MKAVAEPGSGLRNAPFADSSVEELDPEVRDAARTVFPELGDAPRPAARRPPPSPASHREEGSLTTRILAEKRNAPKSGRVFSFSRGVARGF